MRQNSCTEQDSKQHHAFDRNTGARRTAFYAQKDRQRDTEQHRVPPQCSLRHDGRNGRTEHAEQPRQRQRLNGLLTPHNCVGCKQEKGSRCSRCRYKPKRKQYQYKQVRPVQTWAADSTHAQIFSGHLGHHARPSWAWSSSTERITRAGTPPIKVRAGNSPLTTAPAAMTLLAPIIVPPRRMAPVPIQHPSPIWTGSEYPSPATRKPVGSTRCVPVAIVTLGAISQYFPTEIEASPPTTKTSCPIHVSAPMVKSPCS